MILKSRSFHTVIPYVGNNRNLLATDNVCKSFCIHYKNNLIFSFTHIFPHPPTSTCLQMFNEYMFLWQSDRDEVIAEFLATNPILSEFKAEIDKYQELEEKINAIPEKFRIGKLALVSL